MAKSKRKINKSYIILTIIYVIILIILSLLTIYQYNILQTLKNKQQIIKDNLHIINEDNNLLLSSKVKKDEEIDNLKNIKEKNKELKNEVFKLASKAEKVISEGKSDYKIAYLTFDDGPYYSTKQVLDILKKHKVKATFFTIGLNKDICYDNKSVSCAGMYKKIVDNGHTIANHTYSHSIFRGLYSSSSYFISDVKKQEDLIKNRTGVTTNIIRFPGGSSSAGYLKNNIISELKKNGYGWVDWNAQDGDGGNLTSADQAWNIFTNTINENIEVVLFHDYNYYTITILPKAIEYLEERNYIILPLFYESIKINK